MTYTLPTQPPFLIVSQEDGHLMSQLTNIVVISFIIYILLFFSFTYVCQVGTSHGLILLLLISLSFMLLLHLLSTLFMLYIYLSLVRWPLVFIIFQSPFHHSLFLTSMLALCTSTTYIIVCTQKQKETTTLDKVQTAIYN